MTGWVLRRGIATVTAMIRILGLRVDRHWTGYHRFFYRAAWSIEGLSLEVLLQLIEPLIRRAGTRDPVTGRLEVDVLIDETTAGRYGRHVAHAGWYFDASASGSKPSRSTCRTLSCGWRPTATTPKSRSSRSCRRG